MRAPIYLLSAMLLATPALPQCDPCSYPQALECRDAQVKNPPQRRTWDKEIGTKLYFKALEERRELTPWYLLTHRFDVRALGHAEGLFGIDVRARKSGLTHVKLEMLIDRDLDYSTVEEKYLFSGSFFRAAEMFDKDLRRLMNEAKTADDSAGYFIRGMVALPDVDVVVTTVADDEQYRADIQTILDQLCVFGQDN